MIKHTYLLILFSIIFCTKNLFSQVLSATDIYTESIDFVIDTQKLDHAEYPVIIIAPKSYEKNISTYKGKYRIKHVVGFWEGNEDWIGNDISFIDLSSITVSNSELLIVAKVNSVNYRTKKKWRMSEKESVYFYLFFRFDDKENAFFLSNTVEGKFCPNTTG
jgi:hypothetical protein